MFWASKDWLLDLVFLVDITGMLNELIDLIGRDKTIVDTIGVVTAFKQKLKLMSQLQQHALRSLKNMPERENQGLTVVAIMNRYKTSLQILTGVFKI